MSGPTPESLARAGNEHGNQAALFCWAALQADHHTELQLMFAIPNGGLRNKITAANLKAEGVKANVPDIFLPVARGPWHGLFIELKKPGKHNVAPGQHQWIIDLRKQGYGAVICVGWEQARDTILAYLNWS